MDVSVGGRGVRARAPRGLVKTELVVLAEEGDWCGAAPGPVVGLRGVLGVEGARLACQSGGQRKDLEICF